LLKGKCWNDEAEFFRSDVDNVEFNFGRLGQREWLSRERPKVVHRLRFCGLGDSEANLTGYCVMFNAAARRRSGLIERPILLQCGHSHRFV